MEWQEAKDQTIELWTSIREAIGEDADPVRLVADINAVCGLCTKAGEASSGGDRCLYCPFYQQFGGCQEVNFKMSEHAVSREWSRLEVLVDDFLAHLEVLRVQPPESP
jgi:hypothetical protein